ncbi:MAG: HAD family phosphatase [Oscillibacter sp.]|nr:HAD family phosphatase [Oscillibacter sp.]
MDKRACIFDMDGTLVDSMVYWQRLGREYLASRGVTENVEPVLERIKPMTMLESAALFMETFGLPGTPESVAAEMNAVMDEHYRSDIPLKPGALEYLKKLHARGVRLCVATATPEHLARLCLERLGAAELLEFILSCDAVGAGKDRPDVFLEAARRLGTAPADTAAYEDAFFAAQTAKNAGFYTVGVYDAAGAARWQQLQALADETIFDWRNET